MQAVNLLAARVLVAASLLVGVKGLSGQDLIPADKSQFHLIVLAGQSNMAGRGKIAEQDLVEHPNLLSLNKEGEWVRAVAPLHFDKPVAGVGLGRSFAIEYLKEHPGVTVGLIPCAAGGSPIDSWTPGGYHDQTKSHPYDETLRRVAIARRLGTVKAILWHQGESDAKPGRAESYERKLAGLIDRLRSEFEAPRLPFIIGQLGNFPERAWDEHRKRIDAAHQHLAAVVPDCAFASSRGLKHKGDEVHFDAESYRAFGIRYYDALRRLVHGLRPSVVSVDRIWDRATHNAFTDLVRQHDAWYCTFREGSAHVSPDGAIRVLRSKEGQQWSSAALIEDEAFDLRDPKLCVTPDNRLMLSSGCAVNAPSDYTHQSLAWMSDDGSDWSEHVPIGERDHWMWRPVWTQDKALCLGYRTNSRTDRYVRLYESRDGKRFNVLLDKAFSKGYPNESSLLFLPDQTCYCLLRRDPMDDSGTAQLGRASPPYTDWSWTDLGVRIGGPKMLMLDDGRVVAAVRLYDGHVRTALCWVDLEQSRLQEFLRLPSGGDTSYAGMVWHAGELWVSYYSSHEAQGNAFTSAIYLARVQVP